MEKLLRHEISPGMKLIGLRITTPCLCPVNGGLMNNQKPPLFDSERGAKMLTLPSIYQNKKSVHESKNWVRQGIDR
jgi:hypothetical protein